MNEFWRETFKIWLWYMKIGLALSAIGVTGAIVIAVIEALR